jgi:5'/3'-nucleotidase SurE
MRILISNDDGIYSPGIAALANVASRFGDVRVVAPDVEQSSMGHAITASRPLSYRRTPLPGGFTVVPLEAPEEGTDRWAVEHGFTSITPLRLDLTDEKALAEVLARQGPSPDAPQPGHR